MKIDSQVVMLIILFVMKTNVLKVQNRLLDLTAFIVWMRDCNYCMLTWYQLESLMLTFEGPSLIFFIWSLYFISSASILAIFLSIDSILVSTYNGNSTQHPRYIHVWHANTNQDAALMFWETVTTIHYLHCLRSQKG